VTLTDLINLGFTVRVRDGNLAIKPIEKVSPALRERILASKSALILEIRIRDMAAWWRYPDGDLEYTLAAALADPEPWRDLVADDERWREAHPDRRPTVETGHA
jgi:hypothetical protein